MPDLARVQHHLYGTINLFLVVYRRERRLSQRGFMTGRGWLGATLACTRKRLLIWAGVLLADRTVRTCSRLVVAAAACTRYVRHAALCKLVHVYAQHNC